MSFFSSLWKTVTKVAPIAIGYALGGPVGAAVGGAAGSAMRGGDIGQIIQGGMYGYGGANILNALGSAAGAYSSAVGAPTGGGITWNTPLQAAGASLQNSLASALPGGMGGTGSGNLLQLANLGSTAYNAMAGKDAAKTAANQQITALKQAQAQQQAALAQAQTNVSPYLTAGAQTAAGLAPLVNDPNAQAAFIQNNPFYNALATRAKENLFAKAASSGKLYSGGTAEALQNSLLLLGDQLLGNQVGRMQNLANLGANTATSANNLAQTGTQQLGGLTTDIGTAQSAGTIGAYNATNQALTGGLNTAAKLYGINI